MPVRVHRLQTVRLPLLRGRAIFCLLGRSPIPRNTPMAWLRDFSEIAFSDSSPLLRRPFLLNVLMRGLCLQNAVNVGLGRQQLLPVLAGLPVVAVGRFFSASSLAYSAFSALTVGSFFRPRESKCFFAA